jgi:hypothetical protein
MMPGRDEFPSLHSKVGWIQILDSIARTLG